MKDMIHVLLAEDEENDVFFLRHAFAAAGIANPLHVVNDGQEAINYLSGAGQFSDRRQFPLPGLFILDLKMPRKTGLEVLQWKKAQSGLAYLPIIVLTSSAHRNDIEFAYRSGANAFVVKPSSTETRIELARTIKGFWLGFNEALDGNNSSGKGW